MKINNLFLISIIGLSLVGCSISDAQKDQKEPQEIIEEPIVIDEPAQEQEDIDEGNPFPQEEEIETPIEEEPTIDREEEIRKWSSDWSYSYDVNLYDKESARRNECITKNGDFQYDENYCLSDFIRVRQGMKLRCWYGINSPSHFRFVVAYDIDKNVIEDKGSDDCYSYIVPDGVFFVRVSTYKKHEKDHKFRINVGDRALKYKDYSNNLFEHNHNFSKNKDDYDRKYRPFSTLKRNEEKMYLSYRPIGELSKGYFCLVSDDGDIGVSTYTIPKIVKEKNIPVTFAIMKGSPVLEEPYIDTLRESIEDYGCSVAQHGFSNFVDFSEDQLNEFFDTETAYFNSLGFEMRGCVCPNHFINQTVAAVAGYRYGVCRTGWQGNGSKDVTIPKCGYFANNEYSNLYALDSFSIKGSTLEDMKYRIDEALEKHFVMIVMYHEATLTDYQKEVIESSIDYALENSMDFVTLGDIPHLGIRKLWKS